jgi:50S ribosomal subunit-associated GTPase HflX
MLAATKIDAIPPDDRRITQIAGFDAMPISSVSGEGLPELMHKLGTIVKESREADS